MSLHAVRLLFPKTWELELLRLNTNGFVCFFPLRHIVLHIPRYTAAMLRSCTNQKLTRKLQYNKHLYRGIFKYIYRRYDENELYPILVEDFPLQYCIRVHYSSVWILCLRQNKVSFESNATIVTSHLRICTIFRDLITPSILSLFRNLVDVGASGMLRLEERVLLT